MPRTRTRQNRCPECGAPVKDPYKMWELVAPFPDKEMRITATAFGMYERPKCARNSER